MTDTIAKAKAILEGSARGTDCADVARAYLDAVESVRVLREGIERVLNRARGNGMTAIGLVRELQAHDDLRAGDLLDERTVQRRLHCDHQAALENLTATQARCTQLLEENRRLRAGGEVYGADGVVGVLVADEPFATTTERT